MPTKEADQAHRRDHGTGPLAVRREGEPDAGGSPEARIDEVKQQIQSLYNETARLPEKEADARIQQLTAELRGLQSRRAQAKGTAERSGCGTP